MILLLMILSIVLSGCADVPIKDGELVMGKDTTAGMEDAAVAKIKNRF